MAFLTGISDRFWNFVSPRKTQQRREKAFRAAAPPTKAQMQSRIKELNTHKLTPDSRIQNWKVRTPGSPESVDGAMLPPSPPTSAARSPSDYEGDTLVAENFGEFGDDDWNANEETLVVDDGKYMDQQGTFDPKVERERREKQGREMRDSGWSEDAVFLFQKLGMRGFEPLMPVDWIDDFDSLPEDLFTANVDKAFIKPMFDSNYHAQLALSNLLDLGGYVRDAVLTKAPKRTPEYHIKRAVNKYNEWAMKDGEVDQIWNQLSLFDVVSCSKFAHSNVAEKKMTAKLSNLRNLWTDALQLRAMEAGGNSQAGAIIPQVPTLYGVVASHTVMAFVSYVPPSEEGGQAGVRLIAMFDFGEEGYDVWNSLAVAIFVIHCRNRLMQLREYLPEAESTVSEDPDI